MTDAVKEEFIKLVGDIPTRETLEATPDINGVCWQYSDEEYALARLDWHAKLEGFRLARSNGVPAGEADRLDAERYREGIASELLLLNTHDKSVSNNFREGFRYVAIQNVKAWFDEAIDNVIAQQKETENE